MAEGKEFEALYWAGYKIAMLGGCYGCSGFVPERIKAEAEKLTKVHKEKFPKICEKIISKEPNNSHAHYLLGRFYFDEEKYNKAIQLFQKAVTLSSSNHRDKRDAMDFIARSYRNKGNYQQAIQEYQNFINITAQEIPSIGSVDQGTRITCRKLKFSYLKLGLAHLYILAKDYDDARAELQRLVRFYEDSCVTYQARQMLHCMDLYGF